MPSETRQLIVSQMQRFLSFWLDNNHEQSHVIGLTDSTEFISSQHGRLLGFSEITSTLENECQSLANFWRTSNEYVAISSDQAAMSCYLFANVRNPQGESLLFGATLVATLMHQNENWHFKQIRLQINWSRGNSSVISNWQEPFGNRGWQPGDVAPVIVSELHSPWALLPNAPVASDLPTALADLYARYSFAVDQNDMALLVTAYTPDIEGGFAPLGPLSGRDEVIGQLKSFRHLATLWQHFADIVRIEEEGDGQHVKLIVARIIPERPLDENGNKLYGAHYQLRVQRQVAGDWQICWSDYRPGWFGEHQVPDFDIGHVTA